MIEHQSAPSVHQFAHEDPDARVDRTKREAAERVAGLEAEAKNRVGRLEAELVQAKQRCDRAEQWLMLIHREIEGHLMPSVTAMHDRYGQKI